MSKAKPKKASKPEEKLKIKESDEEKNKGDKPGDGEQKPQPVEERWSDWIWDEATKLYYRAKPGNGDEWIYDFACPNLHPATKKETANVISEKYEFPKGEEKVVFVEPKYKFEVSSGRGNEYGVSVREELRAGPTAGREAGKPAGQNAGQNAAGAVKAEGEAKAGGGEEGKRKNLEKSVDDDRGRSVVRKQQKEGKARKKDRDKHHEKKESKHKEKKK
ncbi:hypothetical protein N431DRAFT_431590 [Stipitochalara longipes BDJ]|nr:hypothetical protein N431DRAFT_431590 [Stipitochalara longipes BDJ]